jgi:recombinational DNA repair protein (RecF pathway)
VVFLSATLVAILVFSLLVFVFGFCLLSFGWHPRFRICSSCVAPVRGGTYFSLQRQRKVGKRKPLQTSGARQDNATVHGL